MKNISALCKAIPLAATTLLLVFSLFPAVHAESQEGLISAGEDWCGTQRIFDQKQLQLYGANAAPEACDQYGICDDPLIRDGWVPGVDEPIMYVRMIVHVLAEDDGGHVYSTPEHVAGQV